MVQAEVGHKNRSNKALVIAYISLMVVLTGVHMYFSFAGFEWLHLYTWGAIGLASVVAMAIGVLINKPAAKWAWIVLLLGNVFFLTGDAAYAILVSVLNVQDPFPSFVDVLYLVSYPLWGFGLYLLIKRHSPLKSDRGAALDAAAITLSLALLVWVYLISPTIAGEGTLLQKTVSVFYPLGDILMIAMLFRLVAIDIRTKAVQVLAVGFISLLVADIIYGISQFYGAWNPNGNLDDVIWAIFYGSLGLAALLPSMKTLDRPMDQAMKVHPRRLIMLAVVALVAPSVLFIETLLGNASSVAPIIAVFSAGLFLLVIMRIYILLKESSQNRAEAELEKQRSDLVYLASHQLRTPASSVKSSLSLFLDGYLGKLTKDQMETLQLANQENEHELSIINDILSSAQAGTEGLGLNLQRVDLADLIQKVVDADMPAAVAKKQNVTFDKSGDTTMDADPKKLSIVFENLITNAIEFTPEGGSITITLAAGQKDAEITFKDTGVGIPAEDMPKLFKRFSRASNVAAVKMAGAGLGLYMAKTLVDLHKGSIVAQSELGKGSTFIVNLPK